MKMFFLLITLTSGDVAYISREDVVTLRQYPDRCELVVGFGGGKVAFIPAKEECAELIYRLKIGRNDM